MRRCLWIAVACMTAHAATRAQEVTEVELLVYENKFPFNGRQYFLNQKPYDGTPDITQSQIDQYNSTDEKYRPQIKSGVADGDNVDLTYAGYFTDDDGNMASDVKTATRVVVNILLTGKDASKYKIKDPKTYTCQGAIYPAPVEPPAEALNNFKLSDTELSKEYDGESGLKLLTDSILLYSSDKDYSIHIISGAFGKPGTAGGNDNTPGEGKPITLFYRLSGNPNYALSGANEAGVRSFRYCSSCGTIRKKRPKITVSPARATYGTKIDVRASIPSAEGKGWQSYIFYDDAARRTSLADLNFIPPAGRHTVTVLTEESKTYMGVREDFEILIDPLPLQLQGSPEIAPRPYDGTARLGRVSLPTLASPTDGEVTLSFTIDSSAVRPDVGQYPVFLTPILSDSNYTIGAQTPLTATLTITPAHVATPTLDGSEIQSTKTYDGTPDLPLSQGGSPLTPDGSVFISSARFSSAAAGEWPIFVDIGTDANHVFADGGRLAKGIAYPKAGVIGKRKVSLNGKPSVGLRAYDGSTDISKDLISLPNLTNVVEGDDVCPFVIEARLDKAAAGERMAAIRIGLTGDDAENYELDESELSAPATVSSVLKKPVTIKLRNVENLVYGHSTIGAAPTADAIVDTDPIISGTMQINGLSSSVSLPVGLGQRVRVSFVPVDTVHYEAVDTLLTIDVRPLPLTLSGDVSVADKTYDGNADIPASLISLPSISGALRGDSVSLAVKSASYDSKAAGERAASILLALSGAAAPNYALPADGLQKAEARIAPKNVFADYDAMTIAPRAYDGTTAIYDWQISLPSMTGAIEGDDVAADVCRDGFQYGAADAGTYTVRTHATLTGNDAANYVISGGSGSASIVRQAVITPKVVNAGSVAVADKEYDGAEEIATRLVTVDGGEAVRVLWAKAAAPDAGMREALIRLALANEDDVNHTLADTIVASKINILPRVVEAKWTDLTTDPREYDGTLTISQSQIHIPLISNRVEGDDLKLDMMTSYDSDEAGPRLVTAIASLSGLDASNYALPQDTFLLQSSILPKTLLPDGALGVADREYDGTAGVDTASVSLPTLAGVVSKDQGRVSLDIEDASADSPKAGLRTVSARVRLTGSRAGNYALGSETMTATVRILRKPLTLQGEASVEPRAYDGTDTVDGGLISLPALMGVVPADSAAIGLKFPTAKLDKRDAGSRVATISFSIVGAGIENYDIGRIPLTLTAQTKVTPKALTAAPPTFSSTSKEYDGTTEPPAVATEPELEGVIGHDDVSLLFKAEYDSPLAGRRNITVSYAITGDDSANYEAPRDYVIPGQIVEAADSITGTAYAIGDDGVCGGDELQIGINVESGAPTLFSLAFDADARAAGFTDVVENSLPAPGQDGTFLVTQAVTPSEAYGKFSATLTLHDAKGRSSDPIQLLFMRRPDSSHIHVKFGNTIFIDNIGDRIEAYQWETGGEAIDGATRQFYHVSPSLPAGQYAVRLTLSDGTHVTSCPLNAGSADSGEALAVKAYPNPAKTGEDITVETMGHEGGRHVTVDVFSTSGARVATAQGQGRARLRLPRGIFAGTAKEGGRKADFKIVVE